MVFPSEGSNARAGTTPPPCPFVPWAVPVPKPHGGTSPLHGLDALLDEAGHGAALPLTQHLQGAAEDLVWRGHGEVSTGGRAGGRSVAAVPAGGPYP